LDLVVPFCFSFYLFFFLFLFHTLKSAQIRRDFRRCQSSFKVQCGNWTSSWKGIRSVLSEPRN
jgi:hypothetical protein